MQATRAPTSDHIRRSRNFFFCNLQGKRCQSSVTMVWITRSEIGWCKLAVCSWKLASRSKYGLVMIIFTVNWNNYRFLGRFLTTMGKFRTVLLRFVYFNECTVYFVFKCIPRYGNTVIFLYRQCINWNAYLSYFNININDTLTDFLKFLKN